MFTTVTKRTTLNSFWNRASFEQTFKHILHFNVLSVKIKDVHGNKYFGLLRIPHIFLLKGNIYYGIKRIFIGNIRSILILNML